MVVEKPFRRRSGDPVLGCGNLVRLSMDKAGRSPALLLPQFRGEPIASSEGTTVSAAERSARAWKMFAA